jgi:8-amino-7-oxononanoate synthase
MPRDNALGRRIAARLARWEQDGLLRTLRSPAGVDLSSNDYLGLARDPRIVQAFTSAAEIEGVGSTGSRLLRGERDGFRSLERRFAAFKGTARALYFSSGYLANIAVLTTLPEEGDLIFSDALNHASLIDGIRLSRATAVVVPHGDVRVLATELQRRPCAGIRFVVIESVYSMDGDCAPLAELAAVCREHDAVLIVDEAHAVGVFGHRGTGLIEDAGLDPQEALSINTAGKALGVAGAFVAGPASTVDYLIQRARPFVFSTAAPPAVAAAIEASLSLVEAEPWRRRHVLDLSRHLRRALAAVGVPAAPGVSPIVPIVVGDNGRAVAIARRLNADGFDVRAIRPPSVPEGTARLRVSLNAGLDQATLDDFARALASAFQEAGLCSAVSS